MVIIKEGKEKLGKKEVVRAKEKLRKLRNSKEVKEKLKKLRDSSEWLGRVFACQRCRCLFVLLGKADLKKLEYCGETNEYSDAPGYDEYKLECPWCGFNNTIYK
jgi:hypothetical protein